MLGLIDEMSHKNRVNTQENTEERMKKGEERGQRGNKWFILNQKEEKSIIMTINGSKRNKTTLKSFSVPYPNFVCINDR